VIFKTVILSANFFLYTFITAFNFSFLYEILSIIDIIFKFDLSSLTFLFLNDFKILLSFANIFSIIIIY